MQMVTIPTDGVNLTGDLELPGKARGVVIFAHGAGSSRMSPRNQYVAGVLNQAGLGTLLFDLLTEDEDQVYENRFDIPKLASRLVSVTQWLRQQAQTKSLKFGYFGASTGAAAALIAAAQLPDQVSAVVSRGGRPDLAGDALPNVKAPTLLIVGGDDEGVIEMNEEALAKLKCEKSMELVPGATHLFEEPGTLEQAANLAKEWFVRYI